MCVSAGHRALTRARRGLMLVVVLVMIVLLSLLAASYSFMVRAHLRGVIARTQQFQARMAAEAGVQHAVVILRDRQGDVGAWFDNEDELRSALVIGHEDAEASDKMKRRDDIRTYDKTAGFAFRYSLYAPDFDEPDDVRYGFTDESARLDMNVATEAQLRRLFQMVIPEDPDHEVDINILVDSLLDWRSSGGAPRPNGAKDEYYGTLDPPYRCKSTEFSTVEELLLVRGYSAWVVYGEDYNQNGLLDPNEDDDDTSFPPDNADGVLFRGIAPFLTVWSQEMNTAADNSPRINLKMQDLEKLEEKLEETDLDGELIRYIMDVRGAGIPFSSVMNLIPAPPPPEEEETNDGDAQESTPEPPATTQPDGSDATSQPEGENTESSGGGSSDQDETKRGSENQGATGAPVYQNLTDDEPPGDYSDLPGILDKLTVDATPFFRGRINVSTAPREVLAMIDELTIEEVDAIVEARRELRDEDKSSPAWLLTEDVLDENKFRRILAKITTKSSVYRIESVGFADHIGVVERILYVIQMRGPIPQVLYYRNMNDLGAAYNPYGDEGRELRNRSG
ncbi:MAG: hypothetical protein ACE5EC_01730 [Phycisphaerae bacterium]